MSELIWEDRNGIRVFTLNRPDKRNALNDALVAALKSELGRADADADVKAVVIRGAGKDFCSGADLSSLQKIASATFDENLEDAEGLAELFAMPRRMRMPVVAAVHGRALAGGCGLASACDLVVATGSARFGYPEVKIGFVPAIVAAFLRRSVSEKAAFELATLGVEFSAEEALEMGLINKVLSEEGFEGEWMEYVSAYAKISPSAVQMTKKLLYQIDGKDMDESLRLGARANAEARMTEDCQSGIRKFLDKVQR